MNEHQAEPSAEDYTPSPLGKAGALLAVLGQCSLTLAVIGLPIAWVILLGGAEPESVQEEPLYYLGSGGLLLLCLGWLLVTVDRAPPGARLGKRATWLLLGALLGAGLLGATIGLLPSGPAEAPEELLEVEEDD